MYFNFGVATEAVNDFLNSKPANEYNSMKQFLAEQTERIEEYDEALVRRMVERITVYEDKFTVEFKSGTSVDVDR